MARFYFFRFRFGKKCRCGKLKYLALVTTYEQCWFASRCSGHVGQNRSVVPKYRKGLLCSKKSEQRQNLTFSVSGFVINADVFCENMALSAFISREKWATVNISIFPCPVLKRIQFDGHIENFKTIFGLTIFFRGGISVNSNAEQKVDKIQKAVWLTS